MKRTLPLLSLPMAFLLFSCVNKDYDLSDIDSTIGVNVNELTVPLNLDDITLEALLDLKDNNRIKTINGEYAIVDDGTFTSSPVHVSAIQTNEPSVSPIQDPVTTSVPATLPASGPVLSYPLTETPSHVNIHADEVDKAVVAITHIGTEKTVTRIELKFFDDNDQLKDVVKEFKVEGLKIQYLKGLDATLDHPADTYDPETGIIAVNDRLTDQHRLTLTVTITGIGEQSGMVFDADQRTFDLSQDCHALAGAKITAYRENLTDAFAAAYNPAQIPASIQYYCQPAIPAIVANTFSGQVKYDIEGINIDPVDLSDIPDVLNQTGTDIRLTNPQIYLQLNNPVSEFNLKANANLQLTAHTGEQQQSYTLDDANGFDIDQPDNKLCLSPTDPGTYYKGTIDKDGKTEEVDFDKARHETFTSLSNVLSGDRIPESLDIDVVNPQIPVQPVADFRLGEDISTVNGNYVFYAPLNLTKDAKIKYSDTFDGWNDEDVDAMEITQLFVNANASSDVPMNLTFKIYPIDKEGKKMTDNGKEVVGTVTKTITPKMNEPIEIIVEGNIRHLDGIILDADINGREDGKPLQPDQSIQLKNVRIKLSGTYIKEL